MTNPDNKNRIAPFPGLHTAANRDAEDRVSSARKLADEAEAWLADLDALLDSPL